MDTTIDSPHSIRVIRNPIVSAIFPTNFVLLARYYIALLLCVHHFRESCRNVLLMDNELCVATAYASIGAAGTST